MKKKPKKKMGRPKKKPEKVRAYSLAGVRVTAQELDHLRETAEKQGVSLTDWVRRKLGLE